jgi:hypothetical protein
MEEKDLHNHRVLNKLIEHPEFHFLSFAFDDGFQLMHANCRLPRSVQHKSAQEKDDRGPSSLLAKLSKRRHVSPPGDGSPVINAGSAAVLIPTCNS